MADTVQVIDGFEAGHALAWNCTGMISPLSGVKYTPSNGGWNGHKMDDNYILYLDDGDYVRHGFTTDSDKDCCVSFWIIPGQTDPNHWICAWYEGATLIAHVRMNPTTRNLRFYRGASTEFTHSSTTDYPLTVNELAKIYIRIVFGVASTSADAYVDGIHVISAATDPTYNPTLPDTFQLGGTGKVKSCYDNVTLGNYPLDTRADYHMSRRVPSAAGYSTQWTPSAAPNFDRVNNVPFSFGVGQPNVKSNTADQLDLYEIDNFLSNKTYVNTWAQVQACFEQEGTPSPTQINLAYRINDVTTHGPDEDPDYLGCNTLTWQINGVYSDFDGLQIGIRSRNAGSPSSSPSASSSASGSASPSSSVSPSPSSSASASPSATGGTSPSASASSSPSASISPSPSASESGSPSSSASSSPSGSASESPSASISESPSASESGSPSSSPSQSESASPSASESSSPSSSPSASASSSPSASASGSASASPSSSVSASVAGGEIFRDGGEDGVGQWDSGSQPTLSTSDPYEGTYKIVGSSSGCKASGFSFSEVWGSFRFYTPSDTVEAAFYFQISGTTVASLWKSGSEKWEVKRGGSGGTLLATGTATITLDTWHLVEFHYKAHDTEGRWEVWYDGSETPDIDYTGDTTSGGTTIGTIGIGENYYDNIVLNDTEMPTW